LAGTEWQVNLAGPEWWVNLAGSMWRVNLAGSFGGCVQKEKARGKFKEIKEKQSNSKGVNMHLIFCRPVISHHVDIVHKVLLSLRYSAYILGSPELPKWISCELLM
jgi:hypothetical protein